MGVFASSMGNLERRTLRNGRERVKTKEGLRDNVNNRAVAGGDGSCE